MAASMVLAAAALCLLFGVGLTFYGLVQIAGGRRQRGLGASSRNATAVGAARAASEAATEAPTVSPGATVASAASPALVHFEDQPALHVEPGVLLNTLWEHLTTAECQQGECGGCRLRLLEGEVRWIREPQAAVDRSSEILACSCEPIGSVRCARP